MEERLKGRHQEKFSAPVVFHMIEHLPDGKLFIHPGHFRV